MKQYIDLTRLNFVFLLFRFVTLQVSGTPSFTDASVVSEADIATIIAKITRMPVGKLLDAEKADLLDIEKRLSNRVIGQEQATRAIARSIR